MNEQQRRVHNNAEWEFDLIWRSMDGTARRIVLPGGPVVHTGPSVYEPSVLARQIDDIEVLRELVVMFATLARLAHDELEAKDAEDEDEDGAA